MSKMKLMENYQYIYECLEDHTLEQNWTQDPELVYDIKKGQVLAYDPIEQFLGIYDSAEQALQAQRDWCNSF